MNKRERDRRRIRNALVEFIVSTQSYLPKEDLFDKIEYYEQMSYANLLKAKEQLIEEKPGFASISLVKYIDLCVAYAKHAESYEQKQAMITYCETCRGVQAITVEDATLTPEDVSQDIAIEWCSCQPKKAALNRLENNKRAKKVVTTR